MPEEGVVCAAPLGAAYATPAIDWGGGASSNASDATSKCNSHNFDSFDNYPNIFI